MRLELFVTFNSAFKNELMQPHGASSLAVMGTLPNMLSVVDVLISKVTFPVVISKVSKYKELVWHAPYTRPAFQFGQHNIHQIKADNLRKEDYAGHTVASKFCQRHVPENVCVQF